MVCSSNLRLKVCYVKRGIIKLRHLEIRCLRGRLIWVDNESASKFTFCFLIKWTRRHIHFISGWIIILSFCWFFINQSSMPDFPQAHYRSRCILNLINQALLVPYLMILLWRSEAQRRMQRENYWVSNAVKCGHTSIFWFCFTKIVQIWLQALVIAFITAALWWLPLILLFPDAFK